MRHCMGGTRIASLSSFNYCQFGFLDISYPYSDFKITSILVLYRFLTVLFIYLLYKYNLHYFIIWVNLEKMKNNKVEQISSISQQKFNHSNEKTDWQILPTKQQ